MRELEHFMHNKKWKGKRITWNGKVHRIDWTCVLWNDAIDEPFRNVTIFFSRLFSQPKLKHRYCRPQIATLQFITECNSLSNLPENSLKFPLVFLVFLDFQTFFLMLFFNTHTQHAHKFFFCTNRTCLTNNKNDKCYFVFQLSCCMRIYFLLCSVYKKKFVALLWFDC